MTFQVSKPTNNFYNEMDTWFYVNCQQTDYYNVWKAGLEYLVSHIDKKFFNYELGKPVGLIGFLSEFYKIGEATGLNNTGSVVSRRNFSWRLEWPSSFTDVLHQNADFRKHVFTHASIKTI